MYLFVAIVNEKKVIRHLKLIACEIFVIPAIILDEEM